MNGCDKQRTIFVSATEPWAKFKTIQSGKLSKISASIALMRIHSDPVFTGQ
jgi:hypothetical protein